MKLNLNFKRGGGGGEGPNQKTRCGRGMDIFWNNTMTQVYFDMNEGLLHGRRKMLGAP